MKMPPSAEMVVWECSSYTYTYTYTNECSEPEPCKLCQRMPDSLCDHGRGRLGGHGGKDRWSIVASKLILQAWPLKHRRLQGQ